MAETARLRHAVWRQVDPEAYERQGLSPTNQAVVWIVALSSILAILETEPAVENMAPRVFSQLEWIFALVFFLEYLVRLWAEGESPRFRGVQGRIRYALTPSAIVDLIAFLPSLVLPLLPGTSNFMLLRVFRLIRILRLARLGRFSLAMRHLSQAVTDRKEELPLSLMLATFVLVFSAAGMYVLEGGNDPQTFGSIPRAMWGASARSLPWDTGTSIPIPFLVNPRRGYFDGRDRPDRDANRNSSRGLQRRIPANETYAPRRYRLELNAGAMLKLSFVLPRYI